MTVGRPHGSQRYTVHRMTGRFAAHHSRRHHYCMCNHHLYFPDGVSCPHVPLYVPLSTVTKPASAVAVVR